LNVTLGPVTLAATGRTRTNFAVQHLLVAARLAREVNTVEAENVGAEFGPFYDIVLGSSAGCVVLAAASLESYANETFADRSEHFSSHDQLVLDLLWQEYEQKGVLDKFDLALRLRTGRTLDRGTHGSQAVDRLIRLRNALMHFKPEWVDEADEHAKLSSRLEGYVGRSPWLLDEPLFPRAWATGSSAAWAVASVVSFVAAFATASGIPDRLSKFRDRLGTMRDDK
jgi:hypothetical protein